MRSFARRARPNNPELAKLKAAMASACTITQGLMCRRAALIGSPCSRIRVAREAEVSTFRVDTAQQRKPVVQLPSAVPAAESAPLRSSAEWGLAGMRLTRRRVGAITSLSAIEGHDSQDEYSTPKAARPPATYSQAVKAAGLVFVSGTAPSNPVSPGQILGETIQEQTRQCLAILRQSSKRREARSTRSQALPSCWPMRRTLPHGQNGFAGFRRIRRTCRARSCPSECLD